MRDHTSLVFAAVLAFCLSAAQPALGAGPTREPVPSDSLSFRAGLVCDFPVLIEATRNKATIKTFVNGRLMISGPFFTRVTNTGLGGRSITFNNSDSRSSYFFAEDVGGRRLLRMTGLVRETLAATGITAFSHTGGTTENLCVTLN